MCYITDVCNRKLKEQQEEFDEKLANQQEEFDEKLAEEKRKTVLNMLERHLDDDLIISCTGVTPELLVEIKAGM